MISSVEILHFVGHLSAEPYQEQARWCNSCRSCHCQCSATATVYSSSWKHDL